MGRGGVQKAVKSDALDLLAKLASNFLKADDLFTRNLSKIEFRYDGKLTRPVNIFLN